MSLITTINVTLLVDFRLISHYDVSISGEADPTVNSPVEHSPALRGVLYRRPKVNNNEITIKIAQLRGWTDVKYQGSIIGIPPMDSCLRCTPDWPISIADAWELVEEMRANHFSIKLMAWDHTDKWVVITHHRQGHDEKIPDDEIESDTAPLAICLAYIQWKESQK